MGTQEDRESGLGRGWEEQGMGRGGPRLNRALKSLMQTFYLKRSRSLLENDGILHFKVAVVALCVEAVLLGGKQECWREADQLGGQYCVPGRGDGGPD